MAPGTVKARRMRRLLARHIALEGCALLDIGTGTGEIAAGLQTLGARVTAIDREKHPDLPDSLDFRLVEGSNLPFDDRSFDAAVYTHVIEHVGSRADQRRHLSEIHRVLRGDGVLYLAVPNLWSPVEPHYKLPLLSWFPERVASAYLRLFGRNDRYDCRPLSRADLRSLFAEAGFEAEEITQEVLAAVIGERLRQPLLRRIALTLARQRWLSMPLIPVLVFVARPETTLRIVDSAG